MQPLCLVYTFAVLMKFVTIVLSASFFSGLANRGVEDMSLYTGLSVMQTLTDTVFNAALLLTAAGWRITREAITARERNLAAGGLALYTVLGLSVDVCYAAGNYEANSSCDSIWLVRIASYTVIIVLIILSVSTQVRLQRYTAMTGPWAQSSPAAYYRAIVLARFRFAYFVYIIMPSIEQIAAVGAGARRGGPTGAACVWGLLRRRAAVVYACVIGARHAQYLMLSWRFEWLQESVSDVKDLFMYAYVGFTFLPR